jgi:hypothetical protein
MEKVLGYRIRAIQTNRQAGTLRRFANMFRRRAVKTRRVYVRREHFAPAALFFLAAASLLLGGCSNTDAQWTTVEGIDLIERFARTDAAAQNKNVNRNLSVIRRGLRKDSLALVAPVSVRSSLHGASGRRILKGWATPVFNIGDGIQMDLFINRAGQRRLIGSRYFDAGRMLEDRSWVPISFPVEIEENDQLEIAVSAGPQGDLVADWLALSGLRLVQRNAGL